MPRRALAVGLAALGLAACSRKPDPIGQDIPSVKMRSVPPGGRLRSSYTPVHDGQALRASWEIETDMAWDAYTAWVVAQLAEFRVQADDTGSLRLSRSLAGDVYTLAFRRKPTAQSLRIEATFEARPF